MLKRSLVGVVLSVSLLGLMACSKDTDPVDYLAPLARLAESARDESDARMVKALALLKDELASVPKIAQLLTPGAEGEVEPVAISWGKTPFMAVAVSRADGASPVVFPRGSDAFTAILVAAADGPELGDLQIVPNTFSFTLGMRHLPENGGGTRLSALLDVDRVLMGGVLKPAASAAGGYAFLANRDDRVILSTLPLLMGQTLAKYGLPIAAAGNHAVGQATVGKVDYYVATAKSATANGWTIGVLVPVTSAQDAEPEQAAKWAGYGGLRPVHGDPMGPQLTATVGQHGVDIDIKAINVAAHCCDVVVIPIL